MRRRYLILIAAILLTIVLIFNWIERKFAQEAKRSIEQIGSQILQSEVKIRIIRVSLLSGHGTILDLSVTQGHSPNQTPTLFAKRIRFSLDRRSLWQPPLRISRIDVYNLLVRTERKAKPSNLEKLQKIAETFSYSPDDRVLTANHIVLHSPQVLEIQDLLVTNSIALKLADISWPEYPDQSKSRTTPNWVAKILNSLNQAIERERLTPKNSNR